MASGRGKGSKASGVKARPRKPRARSQERAVEARADYGGPIEGMIARQPPRLRAVADALRRMIEQAAPDAEASLKWGMPAFTVGGRTIALIGIHKTHVNLVLWGSKGTYSDPKGLLSGQGKVGAHLRLTSLEELPRTTVRGWLKTAAQLARPKR